MAQSSDKLKNSEWFYLMVRLVFDFIFSLRNRRDVILDSWIYSAEDCTLSPQAFYDNVQKRVAALEVPGMSVKCVQFPEGGLLSDQRQYLRLLRERLAIDTCAAPFGKRHFFFSCRTVYTPARVRLWHIIATILFFAVVWRGLVYLIGFTDAAFSLVALLFAIVAVFRNAGSSAFSDLDRVLLAIPVVATIYESWFRAETYYRADTRTLYMEILPDLIRKAAEDVCADKGIQLIRRAKD